LLSLFLFSVCFFLICFFEVLFGAACVVGRGGVMVRGVVGVGVVLVAWRLCLK